MSRIYMVTWTKKRKGISINVKCNNWSKKESEIFNHMLIERCASKKQFWLKTKIKFVKCECLRFVMDIYIWANKQMLIWFSELLSMCSPYWFLWEINIFDISKRWEYIFIQCLHLWVILNFAAKFIILASSEVV